jgi:hypothetical protein
MFKTFSMHFFTPGITTFAAVACVNFPLVKQSSFIKHLFNRKQLYLFTRNIRFVKTKF